MSRLEIALAVTLAVVVGVSWYLVGIETAAPMAIAVGGTAAILEKRRRRSIKEAVKTIEEVRKNVDEIESNAVRPTGDHSIAGKRTRERLAALRDKPE